ncbi:MAG: MBL fold metallo-hydrolase [Cyanobacteria bacterium J083]|nr:MAG: MBL fold metallo-hydrolase [Cyanobacteria bacterium J083]
MSHRTQISNNPHYLSCLPYGAGHGSEGICLLLQLGKYRILLDCGLEKIEPLIAKADFALDWIFCSHAHVDHARGLLALHQAAPHIPIYASEVTSILLPLNWQEALPDDFCQSLPWKTPIALAEDLSIELYPAGHLPGAACLALTYSTPTRVYKIFYTGDFSVSNSQFVEGLSIETLRGLAPDVLIIEGTYGTRRHSHRRQQEKQLMSKTLQALGRGENILFPVPPLGIGQEILKLMRSHHQFTGRDLDIWVDGMVAQACNLYLDLLPQFPASVQNFAKHQPLFWDERICPRMHRLQDLKQINSSYPCIVFADWQEDLIPYLQASEHPWLVLLPEYPLLPFADEIVKQLASETFQPEINVDSYLLSEHSDGRNTTQLIHNLRPQHIVFVHGLPNYLADLTGLEELRNRYQLHTPSAETLVHFPLGEKFIQPATSIPAHYEGEINEAGSFINISIPDDITLDPRWEKFAETGLVEVRWQGEEIVIKGISQRELLSQSSGGKRLVDVDCCSNCEYYRGQRCWNMKSPLYGFRVTPEGYCPAFSRKQE